MKNMTLKVIIQLHLYLLAIDNTRMQTSFSELFMIMNVNCLTEKNVEIT